MKKTEEKKIAEQLKHIVGVCDCPATSKTCTYWKHVDTAAFDWQVKEILGVIKKL